MSANLNIRQAAVAGSFYPADPELLHQQVQDLLQKRMQGDAHVSSPPKALIVPHAGYIYSGSIAGQAYSLLKEHASQIKRVILLGPSHHVPFYGVATSSADMYSTPLGDVTIDREAVEKLERLDRVTCLDEAHLHEHCLEVQVPFLQEVLENFTLVPLVVGQWEAEEAEKVFDVVSQLDDSLIIISSDLSHYHNYTEAQAIDNNTNRAILSFDYRLDGSQACGCKPLNGLLRWANQHNWKIEQLGLKNSGDTAGPKDRVVGYGAYALY